MGYFARRTSKFMTWRSAYGVGFICLLTLPGESAERETTPPQRDPDSSEMYLSSREVTESSGLAAARMETGWLFTHNDSGDRARLFAFDRQGREQGVWTVPGITPVDWEDMAAFHWRGTPALLLADTGDNQQTRQSYHLHIISEPRPGHPPTLLDQIEFQYADGPHDCEAIAVDEPHARVLLVAKQLPFRCQVYALPLPAVPQAPGRAPQRGVRPATAKPIGTVAAPMVTGMDISAQGTELAIVNYASLLLYRRDKTDSWEEALRKRPQTIAAPARRQGEAVCFSRDGRHLFLTSEKAPAALIRCAVPNRPADE